jgi:hypothetical protein
MDKVKVNIKTTNLVMGIDDAMVMFKILNKMSVEKIDYDYKPRNGEVDSSSIYYVAPVEGLVELISLRDEDYAMMKLYASTRGEQS